MRRSRQPGRDRTGAAAIPEHGASHTRDTAGLGDGVDRTQGVAAIGDGGGRDRGAFTAELAAGLPALMLLLSFGMAAVMGVSIKMQCQDAAREAALAESRGEPSRDVAERIAPDGASIRVGGDGDSATAEVLAPVRMLGWDLPGLVVRGFSVAAREPEQLTF